MSTARFVGGLDLGGGIACAPAPDAGLPPLLAEMPLLLRASSLTVASYVVGDPWPNEGTAGSDYDAVTGSGSGEPPDPGEVELIEDDGGLGFALSPGDVDTAYFYVPNGPEIEAGAGSFTAFARVKITQATGVFDNIMAKLLGQITVDGHGWQITDATAIGGATGIISNGGTTAPVDPALAIGAATLSLGEHLLVIRLDRATDDLDLFVDDVKVATGDAAGVATVEVDHQLIFGRGTEQIGRAYGFCPRAFTDAEVTVDLPAGLAA